MEITSSLNNNITFRGQWEPNTKYSIGDYVYTKNRIGFYYIATTSGVSQNSTTSTSLSIEPTWVLFGFTYENAIQWEPYKLSSDIDLNNFPIWEPNHLYTVGDIVIPTSGPTIVYGSETIYYGYKIKSIVINPDWPTLMSKTLKDNNIIWETRISYLKLLPEARQSEDMYIELSEIMDYLQLHEEIYFNDIIHKFNDRNKVRFNSLEQIIGEYGYTYISYALDLNEKELRALVSYLQMIHAYKGNQFGLELVFELMNFKNYHAEEWWQQKPKGEPHTWALYVEMDIQNAISNVVSRIIEFTRNYVYPILSKFEVTYNIDIIKAVILVAGFIDKEYRFNLGKNLLLVSTAGFIDKEYKFILEHNALLYNT